VTEYTYDYRNRLTRVEARSSGGIILSEADYTYDIFDRRIAKTVDADGDGTGAAETTRFVYDGDHVWADFDASGTITARYLFGDRIDEILARWQPGNGTAWYLTDRLGTVRDIVDASGLLINTITYDSFGNVLLQTDAAAGDRYLFTGREFDAETGLYYYRARYYDPATGRFISQDPIGFDAGDANLYRYVGNAPTNATDPTGLIAASSYSTALQNIAIIASASREGCFIISVLSGVAGSAVTETVFSTVQGPASPDELSIDIVGNVAVAAISCFLFSPAQFVNASFSAVAVTLNVAGVNAVAGSAVATLTGSNFFAFAQTRNGGGGPTQPNAGDVKRIPKELIDDMGGEAAAAEVKRGVSGNPDLFHNPKNGDIFLPKPGGGFTETNFNVADFIPNWTP